MKIIIAGSRDLGTWSQVTTAIHNSEWDGQITEVVSGTARGVDRMGEEFGRVYKIPVKRFPANWDYYGKSAGYKRNQQMAEYADGLIVVWDGKSRGTKHMIDIMKALGKPVYVEVFRSVK